MKGYKFFSKHPEKRQISKKEAIEILNGLENYMIYSWNHDQWIKFFNKHKINFGDLLFEKAIELMKKYPDIQSTVVDVPMIKTWITGTAEEDFRECFNDIVDRTR